MSRLPCNVGIGQIVCMIFYFEKNWKKNLLRFILFYRDEEIKLRIMCVLFNCEIGFIQVYFVVELFILPPSRSLLENFAGSVPKGTKNWFFTLCAHHYVAYRSVKTSVVYERALSTGLINISKRYVALGCFSESFRW